MQGCYRHPKIPHLYACQFHWWNFYSNKRCYILINTLLHFDEDFVILSLRLRNIIIKTSLHYREDFITASIAIIKFALHTFTKKHEI